MQFISIAILFLSTLAAVTADGLRGKRGLQPAQGGGGGLLGVRFQNPYFSLPIFRFNIFHLHHLSTLVTDVLSFSFAHVCGSERKILGIFSECQYHYFLVCIPR